jgi:hypothetical protein
LKESDNKPLGNHSLIHSLYDFLISTVLEASWLMLQMGKTKALMCTLDAKQETICREENNRLDANRVLTIEVTHPPP